MEKRKENGVRKCPIAIYEATPLPSHEAHVPLARFMLNRDAHCPNLRLELPMHSFEPCSTNNGEGNEGIEIYERPGGQTVINVFFYLFFHGNHDHDSNTPVLDHRRLTLPLHHSEYCVVGNYSTNVSSAENLAKQFCAPDDFERAGLFYQCTTASSLRRPPILPRSGYGPPPASTNDLFPVRTRPSPGTADELIRPSAYLHPIFARKRPSVDSSPCVVLSPIHQSQCGRCRYSPPVFEGQTGVVGGRRRF